MLPNYYAALGIAPTSNSADIRAAYVELMRRYHPDINPSAAAAAQVRAITAAYAIIGIPDRRVRYDLARANHRPGEGTTLSHRPPRRLTPFLAASFAVALAVIVAPLLIPPPSTSPEREGAKPSVRKGEDSVLRQQDDIAPEWDVAALQAADHADVIGASDGRLIVSPRPVIEQASRQPLDPLDASAAPRTMARNQKGKVTAQRSLAVASSEGAVTAAQGIKRTPQLAARAPRTGSIAEIHQARPLHRTLQPTKPSFAGLPSVAAVQPAEDVKPKPRVPQAPAYASRAAPANGASKTPVSQHPPKPAWQRPLPPITPAWQRPLPPVNSGN